MDSTLDYNFKFTESIYSGLEIAPLSHEIKSMAIQPTTNKVIVVGEFLWYGKNSAYNIARVNVDGTYDTTFKIDIFPNGENAGYESTFEDVFCQSDGKIVVRTKQKNDLYIGKTLLSNKSTLFRLNADGTFDNTFVRNYANEISNNSTYTMVDLIQSDMIVNSSGNSFIHIFEVKHKTTNAKAYLLARSNATNNLVASTFFFADILNCLAYNKFNDTILVYGSGGVGLTYVQMMSFSFAGVRNTSFNSPSSIDYVTTNMHDKTKIAKINAICPISTGEYFIVGSFSRCDANYCGGIMKFSATGVRDTSWMKFSTDGLVDEDYGTSHLSGECEIYGVRESTASGDLFIYGRFNNFNGKKCYGVALVNKSTGESSKTFKIGSKLYDYDYWMNIVDNPYLRTHVKKVLTLNNGILIGGNFNRWLNRINIFGGMAFIDYGGNAVNIDQRKMNFASYVNLDIFNLNEANIYNDIITTKEWLLKTIPNHIKTTNTITTAKDNITKYELISNFNVNENYISDYKTNQCVPRGLIVPQNRTWTENERTWDIYGMDIAPYPNGIILYGGDGSRDGNNYRVFYRDDKNEVDSRWNASNGMNVDNLIKGFAHDDVGNVLIFGQYFNNNDRYLTVTNWKGDYKNGVIFPSSKSPNQITNCGKFIHGNQKWLIGGGFTQYANVDTPRIVLIDKVNANDTVSPPKNTSFTLQVNNGQVFTLDVSPNELWSIVAGNFTSVNQTTNTSNKTYNRILRINTVNGTPNTTWISNMGTGFNSDVNAVKILKNGKILCVGSFTNYNGTSINRIAMLNPNGTLYTSFNVGTGFNGTAYSIEEDYYRERVYIGGGFTNYKGTSINRLIAIKFDGSIDTTFNVGTGLNGDVMTIKHDVFSDKIYFMGKFGSYKDGWVVRTIRVDANGNKDNSITTNLSDKIMPLGLGNGGYDYYDVANGENNSSSSNNTIKNVVFNGSSTANRDYSSVYPYQYESPIVTFATRTTTGGIWVDGSTIKIPKQGTYTIKTTGVAILASYLGESVYGEMTTNDISSTSLSVFVNGAYVGAITNNTTKSFSFDANDLVTFGMVVQANPTGQISNSLTDVYFTGTIVVTLS